MRGNKGIATHSRPRCKACGGPFHKHIRKIDYQNVIGGWPKVGCLKYEPAQKEKVNV